MKYNHPKTQNTFESPEQFFKNLQIPSEWRLLGRNDIDNCVGLIYLVKPNLYMRVCYSPIWLGAICEKDTSLTPPSYKTIINNKQSAQINEFFKQLIT